MTTLADLTPEERAECVGMWCEEKDGSMCIYMGADATPEQTGVFAYPASEIPMRVFLNRLTPRPDLPRAWNPDGTPPAGEWQTGKVKIIPNGNAKYDPALNVITGDAVVDPDHEPREAHDIRRWVGEWKTIEEEQA